MSTSTSLNEKLMTSDLYISRSYLHSAHYFTTNNLGGAVVMQSTHSEYYFRDNR